jgi:N-formylglutamate deformylase
MSFHNYMENRFHPILHIPHSSTVIPDMTGYVKDPQGQIDLLTDHATDTLFYYPYAKVVKADFSRVFCDVERFANDTEEPMSKKGMGYFYTHCDDGSLLRENTNNIKEKIYWDYYVPHHEKLVDAVKEYYGQCVIFDCHSFPDTLLKCDDSRCTDRPDICIGYDLRYSKIEMVEVLNHLLKVKGYRVFLNIPYSGTIFPLISDDSDPLGTIGYSYMIEVNRRLYMPDGHVDQRLHDKLQHDLTEVMTLVVDMMNPATKRNI